MLRLSSSQLKRNNFPCHYLHFCIIIIIIIGVVVVVVVVFDETYCWVYLSSDYQFQVYYKVRQVSITKFDRYYKVRQFYYKVR